ncbi:hypothetical protein LZD49_07220 [Dyadobacter sp. CY261]|uniref:hypothetical protein n=1 Tax=Dyadobacter sp. CY261 TaxID=2907203 RepID=UPI001F30E73C|nr:hypothetical protein [Dyadobacter sp. CY261]MCF0070256.1 hypothetical protein [Dyadobacter sp. CY261]
MTHIIGIDPDLDRSGVAIWNADTKVWELAKAISNENLIDEILAVSRPSCSVILMEAGWLNKKANFRKTTGRVSQAISKKVGQNHASGQILMKMLQKEGFEVQEIKPLVKGILKKDGKWTHSGKKFIVENTGITSKMNDEVRDALFIVMISNKRPLY